MKTLTNILLSIIILLSVATAAQSQPIPGALYRFQDLFDTPASYSGQALKVPRVNAGETALEFAPVSAFFDSTEVDDTTWSDGANASNTWTFDLSGTNTTMVFGSGLVTFSHGLTVTGALTASTFLDITPTASQAHSEGRMYYDSDVDTFVMYNAEADIALNVGEENWVFVRNGTGSTITDGQVVYFSGATGGRPNIILAKADAAATSLVAGLATHDIENNTDGYVTVFGVVRGAVNTTGLSGGDPLYLSAATAGALTTTPPTPPNFIVMVAKVMTVSGNGDVFVCADHIDYSDGVVFNSFNTVGDITSGDNFIASLGAEGTPSYTFTGDTDTGMWSPAGDTIALSLGGFEKFRFDGTGLGIGVTPAQKFEIGSDDNSDRISIYHNNTDGYIKWSDGALILQTDEGTNTNTEVKVMGKGTGKGTIIVFDQDNAERFEISMNAGQGIYEVLGVAPQRILIQPSASVPIELYRNSTEGLTQIFQITGFRTGDSKRTLEIGVGVDADDTASFDGVSNYYFDGNLGVSEPAPETLTEWTHTAPYLTVHNNTEEDIDNGGEARIIFKREDGAGTETAAFQFEASHDGPGVNDQLGKGVWYANTGAGLVEGMRLDSNLLLTLAGDLTISGDDLFMLTNTNTALLVADGTNYNPVVPTGDVLMDNAGAVVIQANAVDDTMIDWGLGANQVSIADLPIALGGGSPTVDQMQEYIDNTGSSGFFLGGAISDGGAGTVDVAAGSGFIRTTNDDNAQLESFKWSASAGIAVADDTTQYIYVDDAGTISLNASEFLETPDKIKIGVVTDEGGAIIHTFNLGVRLQESVAEAGRFIRRVHGISRDKRRGGLIMGQSGDANRDVTLSAGSLWWGRTEYIITSFDTSGADTFTTYSAGGQEDAVASQWPNEQYDNAGTLTTMTNNRWANLFFWQEPDDLTVMVYGRAQFVSEALADEEEVPSTSLPSRISETGILVARYTFQKSANTATISSAFEELFANASTSDHTTLSNLAWTTTLHTGTASTLAGFDGGGAAAEYTESTYMLLDGTRAMTGSLYITEAAAASGDTAGLGQIFVKDAAPNTLWFRNDIGAEAQLGIAGSDENVGVDAGATAGYLGAAFNDGVLRTDTGMTYTDGGDFVTLGVGPAWSNWTPVITQGAGVTFTETMAQFVQLGKICIVSCNLSCTSAGTGGSVIVISGLPVNISGSFFTMGSATIVDSGTANYIGTANMATASSINFTAHSTTNQIGADPSFALASGDSITFTIMYETN